MTKRKTNGKRTAVSCFAFIPVLFAGLTLNALHSQGGQEAVTEEPQGGNDMQITSPAFTDGGMIPARYSCDGEDISPALAWSGVPAKTASFALICDDPDAPSGTWVHWVLFNIPGSAKGLPEGIVGEKILPDGSVHGKNSWGRPGYGGPCPPGGTHRYFFKLYALDEKLDLRAGAAKADVEKAMKGHILGEARLMGKYSRQ